MLKPSRQSPTAKPSKRSRKQPLLGMFLVLFYRYPWAFWGAVWMSIAMIAWLALAGILSPGFDGDTVLKASSTQSSVQVSDQPVFVYQPSQPDAALAWVVASIAISCSLGSFMILRRLTNPWSATARPAVNNKRTKKRLTSHYPFVGQPVPGKPSPSKQAAVRQPPGGPMAKQPAAQPKLPPQIAAKRSRAVQPPTLPLSTGAVPPEQYISVREQMQVQSGKNKGRIKPLLRKTNPKPNVTVVPPEKSHVLDWGDAGLAYRLDIRKRRSYR